MTRIDFYTQADDPLAVAVQLTCKAWERNWPVWIRVPDEAVATTLDQLLWTHPAAGFVPHCRASHALAGETPILIDETDQEPRSTHYLINLCRNQPVYFARFERLAEVVGREPEALVLARERYAYYRQRGFELHSHKLDSMRR